ncbi:DMT family transporter [Oleisolibacter albus]|uniref:DMT family transporter n=1 Tax=Oleisolibacter albus TaxID=2171757 RepID=UPI000DF496EA|nr:DMT family transporter [Oleisolibacter albus]
MNDSQWVSLIAGLLVLLLVWRGVRVLPRDGMLRNVVIWLVVFLLLGLAYQTFGPFDAIERRFHRPPPVPAEGGTDI